MKKLSTVLFLSVILSLMAACGNGDLTESTAEGYRYHSDVSIWYVDDRSCLWDNLDELVDEYNGTNGKEHVIQVASKAFEDDKSLVDALLDEDALPSVVLCSADTAAYLSHIGISSHTDTSFQDWQLSRFDSGYLRSGVIGETQYSVPLAASPDILVINNACVSSFSSYRPESLGTLEGLGASAEQFQKEIGAPFFSTESYSSMIRTGMAQLGDTFHASRSEDIASDNFKYVYNLLAQMAFHRSLLISEEDPTESVLKGHVASACVTAQSFMKHVADADPSAFTVLPAPSLENGNGAYGIHFCSAVITGKKEKEQRAAAEFLSWLVASGDRLTADSGYFPAFAVSEGENHAGRISGSSDLYRLVAQAFAQQEASGTVYYPENRAEYYERFGAFEADYRTRLSNLLNS